MELAKTVTGVYVFDDGDLVDSASFLEDQAADLILDEHELEREYADADRITLDTERIADLSDNSVDEVHSLQVTVARQVTQRQLAESGDRDQLLIQAVRALEDLDERNNEMSERLRPWFAVHFPELDDEIDDNEAFADLVAEHADRDSIADAAEDYADLAEESTGVGITERDAAMLSAFADHLSTGYGIREELEAYIQDVAPEVSPNLSAILEPVLAARMLSLAGSLEKLAKMPASTIQVLGAEKAMFRHMRGEGDAPKHGVLFMHPYVQQVPEGKRGDMARFIANKAAIAARLDHFGGDFKGDELETEIAERFEELR